MANYLSHNSGDIKLEQPITVSSGASDAGKIAQTDANGQWDPSLIPATSTGGQFADFNTETISATRVLLITDAYVQYLTPSGGNYNIDLPDPTTSAGRQYRIVHAGNSNRFFIRDSAVTIFTLRRRRAVLIHSNGVQWFVIQLV